MDIKKLTISPVIRGAQSFVVENPTPQTARILMTERIQSNYENPKPAKLKKLPKFLQGWVNPKTRVAKIVKNFM